MYTVGKCEDANNNNNALCDKLLLVCFTNLQLGPTADDKVNNDQRSITHHHFSHMHAISFWLEIECTPLRNLVQAPDKIGTRYA